MYMKVSIILYDIYSESKYLWAIYYGLIVWVILNTSSRVVREYVIKQSFLCANEHMVLFQKAQYVLTISPNVYILYYIVF